METQEKNRKDALTRLLEDLMSAREKGCPVTTDEVGEILVAAADCDVGELEWAYDYLRDKGVLVLSGESVEQYIEEAHPAVTDCTRHYLNRIGSVALLTAEEEKSLAVRIASGDKAAYTALVEANLRLVVAVAKRYAGRSGELDDLIQAGNEGLMRAAERFDPDKGFRFSTYATWWVRQAITRYISHSTRTLYIPGYVRERLDRMRRLSAELEQKTGAAPGAGQLAEQMELPEKTIRLYQTILNKERSFDEAVGEDGDSTLSDLVSDELTPSPEEALNETFIREALSEAVGKLEPREQVVVRDRYGLSDGRPKTLEEIGLLYNITRERVRQVEKRALKKLRNPSSHKVLQEFKRN
ncbi:MAG: sigma-70 family RNA polymerase sigma factor [Clostridiales bacterium]|jgi:RNA polymerase primary sigma factor|nr:sigma-70 family RNA polymerase sigma factor [Clostridiales bacterium]